jgi:hypothetical protein
MPVPVVSDGGQGETKNLQHENCLKRQGEATHQRNFETENRVR